MNNELYHFGTPGMKWGKRKEKPNGTIEKIKRLDRVSKYGIKGADRIETNIKKNKMSPMKARVVESGRASGKVALAAIGGLAIGSVAVAGGVAYKVKKMFK